MAYKSLLFLFLTGCAALPSRGPNPASALPENFSSRAVAFSIECVGQESPHADQGQEPKAHAMRYLHPVFFGCYDWHSAVHGHWAMLRLLDQQPGLPEKKVILEKLGSHLTPAKIQRELAYLRKYPQFEFPYGQAWLLRLAEELNRSSLPEAQAWSLALKPLARWVARNALEILPKLAEPERIGMHDNTAFSLIHAWDYALSAGDQALGDLVRERTLAYYGGDKNCDIASEPGSADFISPCLVEADLMRRVIPPEQFHAWFNEFLPRIPPAYLEPVLPRDPQNYQESHLIGLLYQKASSMRAVAMHLPDSDPRRAQLLGAVPAHLAAAWKLMFESGYGGSHWLATFAIYFYANSGLEN